MILTTHFSWDEVTFSDYAERNNIDNTPPESLHENILKQARLMEAVREILGKPVHVSSWFRCDAVNQGIGGSPLSAHRYGLATDFICRPFGPPLGICLALEPYLKELGVDQLIHEFARWVHIGLPLPGNTSRHETLTAKKVNGKTVYSRGLHPV